MQETAWDSLSCSEFATFSTNERKWITKILSLHEKYPEEVIIKLPPEKNNGVLLADVPKHWLRISPPRTRTLTEEQKEAARERMAKAREAKSKEWWPIDLENRYTNQQAATIHKRGRTQNLTIGVKENHEAMRALSGSGYKMYTYLCENKDNATLLLSPTIFEVATGLSKNSYISAKRELAEKGYLIPKENGDFDFYNSPEMNPMIQKARAEEKARERELRYQQSLERARKLLEEEERRQREIESGILQNPFFPPNWEDDWKEVI